MYMLVSRFGLTFSPIWRYQLDSLGCGQEGDSLGCDEVSQKIISFWHIILE